MKKLIVAILAGMALSVVAFADEPTAAAPAAGAAAAPAAEATAPTAKRARWKEDKKTRRR